MFVQASCNCCYFLNFVELFLLGFLARAKELGDFIKHGKEKATIEIEL